MSSGISVENNEIAPGEEPSDLFDQNSESKMSNSYSGKKSPNLEEKNAGALMEQSKEEALEATNEGKLEENLVEKVNKLGISSKKTGESSESNNIGSVIKTGASESLSYLQDYNTDDDDSFESNEDDSSESDEDGGLQGLQFRDLDDDSEDSDPDSNGDDYVSSDDVFGNGSPTGTKPKTVKKKDENSTPWLSELGLTESPAQIPDISTLELNNKEEFKHIGDIDCILDKLVTIEGLSGIPAYDLDTLFFLDEGQKVLGYVCDVMGPVSSPIYVIHLDSCETVQNLQLKRRTKVYCAPKSKYTKYVFLEELMKTRGSDASWVADAEVPPEFQDFSDDEQERKMKSIKSKSTKRKHGSLERHQQFEANMNKINQLNSRLHNVVDARNPLRQRINNAKPKNDHSKNFFTNPPLAGIPPHWLTRPPPPPKQSIPQLPFDGSQNLETYFQNCTSQFLQHWQPCSTPSSVWRPAHVSNYVAQFDPSTPPPTYRAPIDNYSSLVYEPSLLAGPPPLLHRFPTSRPTNPVGRHRNREDPNFQQNDTAGPSNENLSLYD